MQLHNPKLNYDFSGSFKIQVYCFAKKMTFIVTLNLWMHDFPYAFLSFALTFKLAPSYFSIKGIYETDTFFRTLRRALMPEALNSIW